MNPQCHHHCISCTYFIFFRFRGRYGQFFKNFVVEDDDEIAKSCLYFAGALCQPELIKNTSPKWIKGLSVQLERPNVQFVTADTVLQPNQDSIPNKQVIGTYSIKSKENGQSCHTCIIFNAQNLV